jgi:hypothetical protein
MNIFSECSLRTTRSTELISYRDYVKEISVRRTLNKCEETDRQTVITKYFFFNLRHRRPLNTVKLEFHINNN